MATANDPFQAAERLRREVPDVIVLDVEMPRMDGITFLRRLMAQRPLPVVICSTLVGEGSATFLAALEAGAVDVIQKPNLSTRQFLEDSSIRIQDAILAAAHARLSRRRPVQHGEKLSADAVLPPSPARGDGADDAQGGGDRRLDRRNRGAAPWCCRRCRAPRRRSSWCSTCPRPSLPDFARRLDELCQITVREARDGDSVSARPGADRARRSGTCC